MIQEILKSSAYMRLQKLVQGRFGKIVTLRFIEDVSHFDLQNRDPFIKNGNLHVPILTKNEYLATAVIHDVPNYFAERKNVSQMVRMVIEPALKKWKLLQLAQNAQANLNHFPFQILKHDVDQLLANPFHRPQDISSHFFLLQSKNPHSILRIAVQIHHVVRSWSFLNYKELHYPFRSVNDYKELGPVTLFIEDILVLSQEEKMVLFELFKNHDASTDPLILVGSTSELKNLTPEILTPAEFFLKLNDSKIQIDLLPQNKNLLQETLELILDPYLQLV